jgi:hypothetical protein
MSRRQVTRFALYAAFVGIACSPAEPDRAATPRGTGTNGFDTRYELLDARQQGLVTDWIQRYNEASEKSLDAKGAYNELPLSTKTTFEAVSHALMKTRLTGGEEQPLTTDDGRVLRDALDLVEKLDAIKGKLKGAGGDEQFRIYVQLQSDALRVLGDSREFSRSSDNLLYHQGYPICFRRAGGVPSIQFSISEDGRFADIDVDYRSSKFPAALFNGHLTSANSDVRAGANYTTHLSHFAGLAEWWHGWDGLGEWWSSLHGVREISAPSTIPRRGRGNLGDAAFDFLNAWLVEQDLDVAVSYFSESAYKCLVHDPGTEEARDTPPEQVLRENMRVANDVIGRRDKLATVTQGVVIPELRLPAITDNPYHGQFALSEVPTSRVVDFHCAFRGRSLPRAYRELVSRSGEFRLATFFLKSGEMRGATMSLLWSRESEVWRIVSYELEAAVGLVPDLRARPRSALRRSETVPGDPGFVASSRAFIEAWIVEHDYDAAFEFISPKAYPCLNLFTDGPLADDPSRRLRHALVAVGDFVGEVDRERLADAIEGVEPGGERLPVLDGSDEAVTLLGIPDRLAESFDCSALPDERMPVETRGGDTSGSYYASAFRLKLIGEEPAAFFLVWTRENGTWKIVAFEPVAS